MAYAARTKDDPGDVGRAADQQQSVDNENFLFAGLYGDSTPPPGIIKQWIAKLGLVDNTATNVFTITTTNEAGSNDGGVFHCVFEGFAAHGVGPTIETSIMGYAGRFVRGVNGAGAAGNNSAVVVSPSTTAVGASTAATKSIVTVVMTVVETSEYVQTIQFQVDINGTTITTAEIYGMVTLYYAGFTTPPVIAQV